MKKFCECPLGVEYDRRGKCEECGLPCEHGEIDEGACIWCGMSLPADEMSTKEDEAYEQWKESEAEAEAEGETHAK